VVRPAFWRRAMFLFLLMLLEMVLGVAIFAAFGMVTR
jgi:hypothetical protein